MGNQYPFFLSLLPNESRKLVTMGIAARPAESIDVSDAAETSLTFQWENFLPAFKLCV